MKKVIIIVIALAVIFGVYWFFIRMTKTKAIKLISESGMSEGKDLNATDEKFLKAWAKAIKKAQLTFTSDGKVYNVKGGKNA